MAGEERVSVEKATENRAEIGKRLFPVAGGGTPASVSSPCGAHKRVELHEIHLQSYRKGTDLLCEQIQGDSKR